MTPPLLMITHNHLEPVIRRLEWMTDIQVAREGNEQRRSLRDEPTDGLSYVLTLMNSLDANTFIGILANLVDMQVEFPRWEDTVNLLVNRTIGETLLDVSNGIVGRHFEVGRRILLYRKDQVPEIRTVVTSANPIEIDPLVADWSAGAMIVPLELGRIESPISGADLGNLFRDPTVVVSVDEDLAGVTLDLGAQTLVCDSILLRNSYFNSGASSQVPRGGVMMIYADVFSADGFLIPNPVIVWSWTGSAAIDVYPSGRNGNLILRHDGSAGAASVDVTATVDGVSTTSTLFV